MSTEYLTENQVLRIVLKYFGLDEADDHVLCQWQVDKDGGFDGILIRNNDSEFMRKVRELNLSRV